MDRDLVKEELTSACVALRPRAGTEAEIARFVAILVPIAEDVCGRLNGAAPPAFSQAGRGACERELRALGGAARRFQRATEGLGVPSVVALAHEKLRGGMRLGLPAALRAIEDEARRVRADDEVVGEVGAARPIDPDPRGFSRTSRSTGLGALDEAIGATAAVRIAIERLHQPTILALAKEGLASDVSLTASEAIAFIEAMARRARIAEDVPAIIRGRPSDPRAHGVARVAAHAYKVLTGKDPSYTTEPLTSRRTGRWPAFLEAVLEAIGVRASAGNLARRVADELARVNRLPSRHSPGTIGRLAAKEARRKRTLPGPNDAARPHHLLRIKTT